MRHGSLAHWCRWRRLLPVLALLLAVSAILMVYSDTTDPASRAIGLHWPEGLLRTGQSGHEDDHVRDYSSKFEVTSQWVKVNVTVHGLGSSQRLSHTQDDEGQRFHGNDEEIFNGDMYPKYDSGNSVSHKNPIEKHVTKERERVYYEEYNSVDSEHRKPAEEEIYTLIQDENFQDVEGWYATNMERNGASQVDLSSRHYPRKIIKEIKKYLYTGEVDSSDALFSPCEGPNIPQVKPNPLFGFLGPFRYLANYKNPCWMEPQVDGVPVLHCVPYFYLVGAPKAGSTDLFKRITIHPEVVKPSSKETRWFDRSRFANKPSFSNFLANFKNASAIIARSLERGSNFHRLVTGDGSPSYFFDNRNWPLMPGNERCSEPRVTVASHIHHLYPKVKIIFILRNPVDRLYSSYLYNHAKYARVSREIFDQYVREAIDIYKDCFGRFSLRHCANNATVFSQAKVMLVVSLYSVFVRDWLELFPREQIFVLTTERYKENMESSLKKIFEFLELGPLDSTGRLRSMITEHGPYNKGNHYTKAGSMWPSTRALLEDFYRPYNQQLAHLLNNPDFLWL